VTRASNLGLEDRVGLLDVPEHLHDRLLQASLSDVAEEEVVGHDGQLAQLPLHVLPTCRLARQDLRTRRLRTSEIRFPNLERGLKGHPTHPDTVRSLVLILTVWHPNSS